MFYLLVRLGLIKTPADKMPPPIAGGKHLLRHTDPADRKGVPHPINWNLMRQRSGVAA